MPKKVERTQKNFPTAIIRLHPATWKKLKLVVALNDVALVDFISDCVEKEIEGIDFIAAYNEKMKALK